MTTNRKEAYGEITQDIVPLPNWRSSGLMDAAGGLTGAVSQHNKGGMMGKSDQSNIAQLALKLSLITANRNALKEEINGLNLHRKKTASVLGSLAKRHGDLVEIVTQFRKNWCDVKDEQEAYESGCNCELCIFIRKIDEFLKGE